MAKIRHYSIDSSNLHSIGYDRKTATMEIVFESAKDTVYRYETVPPEMFLDLMNAESPGGYFAKSIKGTGFRFTKHFTGKPADSDLKKNLAKSVSKKKGN